MKRNVLLKNTDLNKWTVYVDGDVAYSDIGWHDVLSVAKREGLKLPDEYVHCWGGEPEYIMEIDAKHLMDQSV